MTRSLPIALGIVSVAATGLGGQATLPLITEATQNYNIVKNNVIQLAERMPDEHYGFKPTGEIRSFGEGVAHVADSQAASCSLVSGERKSVGAAAKTTKAELVAVLKESYAECDAAFAGLTDVTVSQMVRLGQSARYRSKMGLLIGMISHSNEQYGYLSVYMRLKGLVPPSTEAAR